jgi:hypothetical protein
MIEQTFSEGSTEQYANAIEYLQSFSVDSPNGRDSIESLFRCCSHESHLICSSVLNNYSSGGYAEYLYRYIAKKIHQIDLSQQEIQYSFGRNPDIAEAVLVKSPSDSENGEIVPLMKFARIYGFRNIQSVLLKMKRKKCDYDYIEIMACPGGCVNGGGQIKEVEHESPREISNRIQKTSSSLHSALVLRFPDESPLVRFLYGLGSRINDQSLEGICDEIDSPFQSYFHTQYHAIPKLETMAPLASKW